MSNDLRKFLELCNKCDNMRPVIFERIEDGVLDPQACVCYVELLPSEKADPKRRQMLGLIKGLSIGVYWKAETGRLLINAAGSMGTSAGIDRVHKIVNLWNADIQDIGRIVFQMTDSTVLWTNMFCMRLGTDILPVHSQEMLDCIAKNLSQFSLETAVCSNYLGQSLASKA